MAFPKVTGHTQGTQETSSTSHTITLPSGIVAGELLLVVFSHGSSSATVSWPTGWTEVLDQSWAAVGYKIANGSETTINLTTSVSTTSLYHAYRIMNGASVAASSATGTSNTPNPPLLTLTSAKDCLWLAAARGLGSTFNFTANPPLYSDAFTVSLADGSNAFRAMTRTKRAASEDPGAYTTSVSLTWTALTIGVVPASDLTLRGRPCFVNVVRQVQSPSTGISFSYTVPASSYPAVLLVCISTTGTNATHASVTYGGLALTKAVEALRSAQNRSSIWYLASPPLGVSQTLTVTLGVSQTDLIVLALTAANANQTTPVAFTGGNNGEGVQPSLSLTQTVYPSQTILALLSQNASPPEPAPTPPQTVVSTGPLVASLRQAVSSKVVAPPGTTTISWIGGTHPWSIAAVVINPASTNIMVIPAKRDSFSTTATTYLAVGRFVSTNSASEVEGPLARDSIFTHMYVKLTVAPGAGKSWTITLLKNGTSTGQSVTVSDSATVGESNTPVSFVTGDRYAIQVTPSGTPASTRIDILLTVEGNSTTEEAVAIFPATNSLGSGNAYNNPFAVTGWGTLSTQNYAILPTAITVTSFIVRLSAAPGGGSSRTFHIDRNDTSVASITISGTGTTGSWTGTATFSAGDTIRIRQTTSGTPTTAFMSGSLAYHLHDDDGWIVSSTGAPPSATTYYGQIVGDYNWSTTPTSIGEAILSPFLNLGSLRALAVYSNSAITGGSWTISVVHGSTGDALIRAPSITLSGSGGGVTTQESIFNITQPFKLKFEPSGSPNVPGSGFGWGLLLQHDPQLTGSPASLASTLSFSQIRNLFGTLSALSATLSTVKVVISNLSGTLSALSATLAKQLPRSLSGTLSALSATLTKQLLRSLSGTLSALSATLTKQLLRSLSGTLSALSATLSTVKVVISNLSGTLSALSATLAKRTQRALTGLINTPNATNIRKTITSKAGALSGTSGSILKQIQKGASGAIASFTGNLTKIRSVILDGTLLLISGLMNLTFLRSLTGFLSALKGVMPFPSVEDVTFSSSSSGTNHTIQLPNAQKGDLLLLFFAPADTFSPNPLPGWSLVATTETVPFSVYSRVADGTESPTITLTGSPPTHSLHMVYRIKGAQVASGTAIEFSGSSNTIDPPNHITGLGERNYLWLTAAYVRNGSTDFVFDVDPDGYENPQTNTHPLENGFKLRILQREAIIGEQDPSVFQTDTAVTTRKACTVACVPSTTGIRWLSRVRRYRILPVRAPWR